MDAADDPVDAAAIWDKTMANDSPIPLFGHCTTEQRRGGVRRKLFCVPAYNC